MNETYNMKITRQEYIDGDINNARLAGCDCFQLKYDGWWCRMEVTNGLFQMFNKEGREVKNGCINANLTGRFIGEYMFGTNWAQDPSRKEKFYVFDCWGFNHHGSTESWSFRDRYSILRTFAPHFPDWMQIIAVQPLPNFERIWQAEVENGAFEGVVYRRRSDSVLEKLMRQKKDFEATYTCTGFVEGEGKHTGRLGAVLTDKKTDTGEIASVGGGFDDSEREYIWQHKEQFLGRQFDCVGKGFFPTSGLLRHPNFVRWKE